MKRIILFYMATGVCTLLGETVDAAYARLTAYRSVWETNAWAYVETVPVVTNKALAEANGRWFVDFLQYPDVTETNRLSEVILAKDYAILHNGGRIGIYDNTNAWYAVADYIAHLKDVADPRWIDESYIVVTDVMDDGVKIIANTNPLLDFASYKLEHFTAFRQAHTNLVNEIDALNAFSRDWDGMILSNIRREKMLNGALVEPKRTIRETFWWFGTKNMSEEEKSVCRSNIVARAHLTPAEEHFIFDDKPDLYYKIMGIKKPRDGDR